MISIDDYDNIIDMIENALDAVNAALDKCATSCIELEYLMRYLDENVQERDEGEEELDGEDHTRDIWPN